MKRLIILHLFIGITATAFAQQENQLSLKDYFDYETVSNPQLSPDGKQIIYNRNWINPVDDKRESDLWIMNSDGSQNRFFITGSAGVWSPDGSKIAFLREGEPKGTQIFIKHLGLEGEPTQITRVESSPGNMKWSPDGKYISFTMFQKSKDRIKLDIPAPPEGAKWTETPRVVDQVNYRRDRIGFLENGFTHIFVVPSEGGTARQITYGDFDHNGYHEWTSDGSRIVFSGLREEDADYKLREANIYAAEVRSGKITTLTTRQGAEGTPKISPDGKRIAFRGNVPKETFYNDSKLYVMNMDGSGLEVITGKLDRNPGDFFWAPDNSGVYFNVETEGTENFYFANFKGSVKEVSNGEHVFSVSDLNKNGSAVGVLTSSQAPPDVYLLNIKSAQLTRLTNVNSDILDFKNIGRVEEIRYKSVDNMEIQGWIVYPPDFDPNEKHPLILRIHGGPHSMYDVGFNFTYQIHAAKGYVVLYTNPRGSTGYGYDFANAIQNAYPGKDYDDLMKGVDEVIKKGFIDENRLYVYGGSGGGVLTSWIIGQTDRFAAASVMFPVVNWFSFVGTTDGISWYKNFENYPWEDPSEHIQRSPLMYVGNVKTPTLLMTGVNDLRTPISQTEEYYQALKAQKKTVLMVRFNEEFHGTSSKPSNYLRTMGYLDYWFSNYTRTDKSNLNTKFDSDK